MAHLKKDIAGIVATARIVVIADFLFTLPAVIVQPVSGLWLVWHVGYSLSELWLWLAILLYLLLGACWIPVVFLQIRCRDLATSALHAGQPLPAPYYRAMWLWFWLGWPAVLSVVAIYVLMLAKPTL